MAKRLRRLKILEASLVDRPANQHAHVLLWKRDDRGNEGESDMPTMDDETKALLEDMQGQIGDLTKSNADLTKQIQDAKKAQEEAEAKMEKLRKAKGRLADDSDEESDNNPLLKGISPALKQLFDDLSQKAADQEKRLAAQEHQREVEAAEKKISKRWPTLPFKAGNFAPIWAKIEKALEADEVLSLERIFDSHKAFASLADREIGYGGGYAMDGDGGADAWAQIEAKAKDLRKLHPTLTKEQAIDKAMTDNPELYKRYQQEAS